MCIFESTIFGSMLKYSFDQLLQDTSIPMTVMWMHSWMSYSKLASIFRALTIVAVGSVPVSNFSTHQRHQKKFAQQQLPACLARSALLIISHLRVPPIRSLSFFPTGKPHFHSKLLGILLLYSACGTRRLSWLLTNFYDRNKEMVIYCSTSIPFPPPRL